MTNVIFSILAGLGFGVGMFMRKISVGKLGMNAYIFEALFALIISLIFIPIFFPFDIRTTIKNSGIFYAIFGGILTGLGIISFFKASLSGSIIIPSLIAPVLGAIVVVFLAVIFLKDSLTLLKISGLFISVFGLYLFIK